MTYIISNYWLTLFLKFHDNTEKKERILCLPDTCLPARLPTRPTDSPTFKIPGNRKPSYFSSRTYYEDTLWWALLIVLTGGVEETKDITGVIDPLQLREDQLGQLEKPKEDMGNDGFGFHMFCDIAMLNDTVRYVVNGTAIFRVKCLAEDC